MKTRHALLALLLAGSLLVVLATLRGGSPVHADEGGPAFRPTPTPVRPGQEPLLTADELAAINAPLPDLVVTNISVVPNPPLVNRPVTINVTIANIGEAPVEDTNNFFVDLYINPATAPRPCVPGIFFWSVQGFEVGSGATTLSITLDPEEDPRAAAFRDVGVTTIWAQVDNSTGAGTNECGNVVESREDNNLRALVVDVQTKFDWEQTTPQDFQSGFTSALDLTHPLGILQNGTGWFDEPRFPQPEDPAWPVNPFEPWNSSTFYNPDLHVQANNFPDAFPIDQLQLWNPEDQENLSLQVVPGAGVDGGDILFALWEDARNGDLNDRDIYSAFSFNGGKNWEPAVRVNQDPLNNGANQLKPQLVIVRETEPLTLFAFWQDNRLGDYDIFFARAEFVDSDDADPRPDLVWEEPLYDVNTGNDIYGADLEAVNPISDKDVDPGVDQINVTASASYEVDCVRGNPTYYNEPNPNLPPEELADQDARLARQQRAECIHLFVAWEDYRNGNADIFFDWSYNGGYSFLKSDDGVDTTVDANIHVQPDPTTNAGIFDQKSPQIVVEEAVIEQRPNYCLRRVITEQIYDSNNVLLYERTQYFPYATLPAVYIVWEDERDITFGDASSIFYTRGQFNYKPLLNQTPTPPYGTYPRYQTENCEAEYEVPNSDSYFLNRNQTHQINSEAGLPAYRFEDDHVRVNRFASGLGVQVAPSAGFDNNGFYSQQFEQSQGEARSYTCEVRWHTKELALTWQDNRDGTNDIWSTNVMDELSAYPEYSIITDDLTPIEFGTYYNLKPEDEGFEAQVLERRRFSAQMCLGNRQITTLQDDASFPLQGMGDTEAPYAWPLIPRNADESSPQPPKFFDLGMPAGAEIKISEELTFVPKPLCRAPNEPIAAPIEPSEQTDPEMTMLPAPDYLIAMAKSEITDTINSTLYWNVWADTRSLDNVNEDIFLRPVVRRDSERTITIEDETGDPILLQTVQDNVKNQVLLKARDVVEDFAPPNVQQNLPTITFYDADRDINTPVDLALYVGWQDNRNANPLLGFEGNSDVFAARLVLDEPLYNGEYGLRPLRSGAFLSSVFGDGDVERTWYDIEWWGDISADGVLSFQTRFGLDPDSPEPPQENIEANGWTQWTGIGGTGGAYTAPGQHIRGPDGSRFPTSYYVQYRVNFNTLGQEGIHCISAVGLNFEQPEYDLYLPLVLR